MQQAKREDNGALFPTRNKTSQNSPDLTGNITFSPDLIKYLVDKVQNGEEPRIRLAAWRKRSAQGMDYYSVAAKEDEPFGGKQATNRREFQQPAQRNFQQSPDPNENKYRQSRPGVYSNRPAKAAPMNRNDLDDEIPF